MVRCEKKSQLPKLSLSSSLPQRDKRNSLHKPPILLDLRDRQPFTRVDLQELEEEFCRVGFGIVGGEGEAVSG